MRGSIVQRGPHSWAAVVDVGRDPVTGKRRQRWISGKSREEVKDKRLEILGQLRTGGYVKPAKVRLGDWLERWITERPRAASTIHGYRNILRHVRQAPIGAVPLRDLTPEHLAVYYTSRMAKGLSGTSVRGHHRVLSAALQQATKWRYLGQNPAKLVDPPPAEAFEAQILDTEQMRLFLGEAKRSSRYYPLYLVAATTGLRQSELLGARWQDLQPDGTLLVRKAFLRIGKQQVWKAPKSPKSRRKVALSQGVFAVLREIRATQQDAKAVLSADYHDHDLIFCQADGKPLHAHNMTQRDYKAVLRRAGLPAKAIRFHDQRHSHLSHLERLGVPMSVTQQRAGHSNPAITLGIYTHALGDAQREAARLVEEELLGRGPSSPEGSE